MRRGPSICANHADRLGDQYLLRVTRSIRGHRTQADALHLNQFGRGQTRGCDHYLQPVRWVLCMVAGGVLPESPGARRDYGSSDDRPALRAAGLTSVCPGGHRVAALCDDPWWPPGSAATTGAGLMCL